MKKSLFLILLSISCVVAKAQKTYVWCPGEIKVNGRHGFLSGDTVYLDIFDGRVLTNLKKDKCDPNQLSVDIMNSFKKAYPDAIIVSRPASEYQKEPNMTGITIKIGISAYQAAFGSDIKTGIGSVGGDFSYGIFPEAQWNAVTAYFIRSFDMRGGDVVKKSREISKSSSVPNGFGYKSARKALDETFNKANSDLFFFLDEALSKL